MTNTEMIDTIERAIESMYLQPGGPTTRQQLETIPNLMGMLDALDNQPQRARVYQLTHETWNDGFYSDFALPRVIGWFTTERAAERKRDEHMARFAGNGREEDTVTANDYRITPIDVEA